MIHKFTVYLRLAQIAVIVDKFKVQLEKTEESINYLVLGLVNRNPQIIKNTRTICEQYYQESLSFRPLNTDICHLIITDGFFRFD
jgi:hypothetical protein